MSIFAKATALGQWPGKNLYQASNIIINELAQDLPFIPYLPARGMGADFIGRSGAILIDLPFDTSIRGYCLTSRPGKVIRHIRSLLAQDYEIFEELWEKTGMKSSQIPVKIHTPGPISLAAQLELSNGHTAITDPVALHDITESLAEGIYQHVTYLQQRLNTTIVVQFDEPYLAQALEGSLEGFTIFQPIAPLSTEKVCELLNVCFHATHTSTSLWCIPTPQIWAVLTRLNTHAVMIPTTCLTTDDYEGLAQLFDQRQTVVLGIVPTHQIPLSDTLITTLSTILSTLGFPIEDLLNHMGISPDATLADNTVLTAQTILALTKNLHHTLISDPELLIKP